MKLISVMFHFPHEKTQNVKYISTKRFGLQEIHRAKQLSNYRIDLTNFLPVTYSLPANVAGHLTWFPWVHQMFFAMN